MKAQRNFFWCFVSCGMVMSIVVSSNTLASSWQLSNNLSIYPRASNDYSAVQSQIDFPTTLWPNPVVVDQDTRTSSAQLMLHSQSSEAFFYGFAPILAEGPAVRLFHQGEQHDYRAQLQLGYRVSESDQPDWILDESFMDINVDGWRIGAGAVSRWWGPGWDSSLILSANARTAPGLYLDRAEFSAFATPWLSWLGPWHLVTFMSQLESDRDFSDALLWGARLTFKPTPALEIGLNRTAIWGGEGRPQSLGVFKDLLLGQDNFEADQAGKTTEPGDQLAGFDLKYSVLRNKQVYACYTQWIGEDEAGGAPSGFLGQVGCSLQTPWQNYLTTVFVETSNTVMGGWTGEQQFGSAYEHSIYQDGYRYRDRSLGSQYDGDSKSLVIGGILQATARQSYRVIVRDLRLNLGNLSPSGLAGNQVAPSYLKTQQLDLAWSTSWPLYQIELGYVYNTQIKEDSILNAHSTLLGTLTRSLE